MDINLISRQRVLPLAFVAIIIGISPTFAQSQAQQNPTTGCYSGPGFEAEKNAACGTQSRSLGPAQTTAPQKAEESGCYSGPGFEAEKNAACGTQSRTLAPAQNGAASASGNQPGHYSGPPSQIERENMLRHPQ